MRSHKYNGSSGSFGHWINTYSLLTLLKQRHLRYATLSLLRVKYHVLIIRRIRFTLDDTQVSEKSLNGKAPISSILLLCCIKSIDPQLFLNAGSKVTADIDIFVIESGLSDFRMI